MRPPARAEWLALADRIVSHPATWLAGGNAVLVNHVSGLLSALPAAASAVLVIATIAAAYRRGEEAKLPFFIHGTLTVTSGLLALGEVLARVPAAELAAFEPQVRGDLLASAAIVGWGVGHLFSGALDAHDWAQRPAGAPARLVRAMNCSPRHTNMICYSAADISAIAANPVRVDPLAMAFALAGLGRSFVPVAARREAVRGLLPAALWHLTPARLLAAGYLVNGFLALRTDPAFALASLMFAIGAFNFDRAENDVLRRAVRLRR